MVAVQSFFQNQASFQNPLVRPGPARTALPQNFHQRAPVLSARRLGQAATPRDKAIFYGAGLLNLAFLGATIWVGLTVGRQKKGALGVAGYVTGIGAALAALYSLGIMGVETTKPVQTVVVPSTSSQQ